MLTTCLRGFVETKYGTDLARSLLTAVFRMRWLSSLCHFIHRRVRQGGVSAQPEEGVWMESHLSLGGLGDPAGNECPVIRDIPAGAEDRLSGREWRTPWRTRADGSGPANPPA